MIQIVNLAKYYPNQAQPTLADINLCIEKEEVLGIVGKTGAGKSTLIRTLNGLEKPSQGKVLIEEVDLTSLNPKSLREIRKKIGMIFQHFNLLQSKTVFENVALPLRLNHENKNISSRIMEMLERVGLAEKAQVYPQQLSGGQKQRVAIARALIHEPNILLCDEATSALDPETTQSILKLLKTLQKELKLTLVMVTHQMEVVKSICDRVVIMQEGKIVEIAPVEQFFIRPQTTIGKALAQIGLRENLPAHFQIPWDQNSIRCQTLLRIFFRHETVKKPVISEIVHRFQVEINILQANIESIRFNTIGIMIVLLSGKREDINQTIAYLQQESVEVEEISQ